MNLLMMMFISTSMCTMLMMMPLSTMKMKTNNQSPSQFECGFNNSNLQKPPFSPNFFMFSIMFLMFDLEMTAIMPMIMMQKTSNMTMTMAPWMFSIISLMIMTEWSMGSLEWTK